MSPHTSDAKLHFNYELATMNDKEFYTQLDEIMQELLPGVAHLCLTDYGKLNDVCMEITKRRKEALQS